jgi:predicted dehydrogenase
MRIGILSFAHHHAESYIHQLRAIPGAELTGLADDDLERGRSYAETHGTRLFPSYEALLADEPDGVLICSENSQHRTLTELAAQAGVHIMCEKPLATNLADAQAMINACARAEVILLTAFPMRFSAPILAVKERLDEGDLGQVYCYNTTNQGRMPINERRWFVDKKLAGGGAVIDHTVHLADILRWFTKSDVVEVYAQTNRIMHRDIVEVETGGQLMLTFDDGAFATIDASWSKPLNYPTWGGLTMEIISQRGLTRVDAFKQNLNVYQQEPAANKWLYWGSDADRGMVEGFLAAIEQADRPGSSSPDRTGQGATGYDGYKALEVALAAYRSAEIGRPVQLPLTIH